MTAQPLIVGRTALIVVDIQQGSFLPAEANGIPLMPGFSGRQRRAPGVPMVFLQEIHHRGMVDYGRELDGAEGLHCMEGEAGTPIAAKVVGLRPDDIVIPKRRYSGFFGTDLGIVRRGLRAETLLPVGGLTDVRIDYTVAHARQHDSVTRVIEDGVAGSGIAAHEASLNAMEYLQTRARQISSEVIVAFAPATAAQ